MKWPTFRRGKHESRADHPTHPLYADQKVLGLALSLRAKLFLTLVALLLAIGLVEILALNSVITRNHENSVNDRRQLACFLVHEQPPGLPLVDELRAKYGCPPYRGPAPTTSPATPSLSRSTHAALPAKPTPTVRVSPPAPTPATTRTVTVPLIRPTTVTRRRTVTATHTTTVRPRPSPSPTLCVILPVICGLPVR